MSKDSPSVISKQDIARAASDTRFLSSIDEIIEEARNGRMFILVDDEDRENEGDLVIPAQMATPEAINFMAKYGRGLICLALQGEQVKRLGLELMPQKNASRFGTAFTVSIEAREGVTTGISAPDRARTIAAAVAPNATPEDVTTPGEMARLPDLIKFAQFHGLKVGAIADLIAHRRQHDRVVDRTESTTLTSVHGGEFTMHVYVNRLNYAEHVALVKGDLKAGTPAFVRMHALSILDDVLMDSEGGKAGDLQKAMDLIGQEGCGVVVLIREPHATSLSDRVRRRENKATEDATGELRDYGIGAQILADLGVHDMVLLSNTDKTVIGLEGYGLKIVGRKALG
mgnify:CR=1 FL=1